MKTERSMFWKFFQSLKKDVVTGLIVFIPFGATIIVAKFIFDVLNDFSPNIKKLAGVEIPGLGIIITIILLGFLGMITRNVLGRSVLSYFEKLISKAPIIGMIFRSSKQLISTFNLGGNLAYKKVILIEYPRPGLKVIAFITGNSEDSKGQKYYQVFVPTTPNPTSGMMEIVPVEQVVMTNWSVEEAIKIVVSGGVLMPDRKFDA